MKLSIHNFSKIKQADILIDGITVIAGENNTGKSTVGKILFSLFNAISGIEDKILYQRIKEIEETSRLLLRNFNLYDSSSRISISRNASLFSRRISQRLEALLDSQDNVDQAQILNVIEEVVRTAREDVQTDAYQEVFNDIANKIYEILKLSEDTIMLEILSRYFNEVFHGQINSLIAQETTANLQLNIKNKNIFLSFIENQCVDFNSEISLLHKAIYIDNPFIIDKLEDYIHFNTMDQFLKSLLTATSDDKIMDGVIETILAKEKLSEIYQSLQSVVEGEIITKKDGEYYLEKSGFAQPISFSNLSTGLKSFVIIKMLLEKGKITEKDVLILDEPEIHLHPQWQIAYAELIVLLQKYFDLSIIVTTHSPYFLDAINLFSVKHGVNKKVNYYLSSMENNNVKMTYVTQNIDLIYQKMASPIQILDTLRYELNNN